MGKALRTATELKILSTCGVDGSGELDAATVRALGFIERVARADRFSRQAFMAQGITAFGTLFSYRINCGECTAKKRIEMDGVRNPPAFAFLANGPDGVESAIKCMGVAQWFNGGKLFGSRRTKNVGG